jgi:putative hydrolase of the HAD superfamily
MPAAGSVARSTLVRRADRALSAELDARLSPHTQKALLVRDRRNLGTRNPAHVERFIACIECGVRRSDQEVADVEVKMRGLSSPGGDRVDIDVQGHRLGAAGQNFELFDPRFLAGLPEGNSERIGLAIGVSTRLQPSIELGVMQEKDVAVIPRDDPGRAGHVPFETGSVETIRTTLDELDEAVYPIMLLDVTLAIPTQEPKKQSAVHTEESHADRWLPSKGDRRTPDASRSDLTPQSATPGKMSYRAVIFDLGGVVLGSPLHVIRDYEREKGIEEGFVNRTVVRTGHDGAWSRLERGELDLEAFYPAFDRDCADAGPAFSAREMMERIGETTGPRPQMLAAIGRIRARGLATAALTNNWKSDDAAWNVLGDHFDAYVESAVEGVRKPDPRIYHIACERLSVEPSGAVFLDDIGRNLKTARELGMATIKVDDPDVALANLETLLGFDLR